MVLINDKKFACATCIKGHRVSGCTHTERPLFEIKKKGRPSTQCNHCKDKRKSGTGGANNGAVHSKCACGDPKTTVVLPPATTAPPLPRTTSEASETSEDVFETRKGVPGSNPTFPNGLKDVHEMAQAAEALSGMGGDDEHMRMAERKVANLLNPCHCRTGGPCKCCQPKRERLHSPGPSSSGSRTPNGTDGLAEMFKRKATTAATPPEPSSCCGSSRRTPSLTISTADGIMDPAWAKIIQPENHYLSPDHMHHPSHTSPHVHKAKLYSPYSTSPNPKHGSRRHSAASERGRGGWASSSTNKLPPPRLRPLADMNRFLGAVFNDDGSVAENIPRSALGLPGIQSFDAVAQNGGAKVEPMEMEVDAPVSFPTSEDVVIAACTCGEDCECPGCAMHDNAGKEGHAHHEGGCGDGCKSSFDCADHLSLPSGITSIGHLLSLAAANVPPPARPRPHDLNAHDTRVLPPTVHLSEEAARTHGVVSLKPLECCNGRCQCAAGQCTCEKDCCGCCVRCACDEDADKSMGSSSQPSSCCSDNTMLAADSRMSAPLLSPTTINPNQLTPPLLSPESAYGAQVSRPVSPSPQEPPGVLRRASSSSSRNQEKKAGSSRRATITTGTTARSASTGKQASKALALNIPANHPHGPKASPGHLGPPKSTGTSRSGSPSHSRASSIHSRSPAMLPAEFPSDPMDGLPTINVPTLPNISSENQAEVPDLSFTDFSSDTDFMDYINQLAGQVNLNLTTPYQYQTASSEGSVDHQLRTPDIPFEPPSFNTSPVYPFNPASIPSETPAESFRPNVQPDYFTNFAPPFQAAPERSPKDDAPQQPSQMADPMYSSNLVDLWLATHASGDAEMLPTGIPSTSTVPPPQTSYPPLQSSAYLQQLLSQRSSIPTTTQGSNPNVIDLSKPLDAGDVEKILKALQEQQARQSIAQTQPNHQSHSSQGSSQGQQGMGFPQARMGQPGSEGIDDLFANFTFDPSLMRDANGPNEYPDMRYFSNSN